MKLLNSYTRLEMIKSNYLINNISMHAVYWFLIVHAVY